MPMYPIPFEGGMPSPGRKGPSIYDLMNRYRSPYGGAGGKGVMPGPPRPIAPPAASGAGVGDFMARMQALRQGAAMQQRMIPRQR